MLEVGWVRGGRGEIGCRLKGNDSTRNHRGISAAPTSERVQESSVLFVPLQPTTRRGSPDTEFSKTALLQRAAQWMMWEREEEVGDEEETAADGETVGAVPLALTMLMTDTSFCEERRG